MLDKIVSKCHVENTKVPRGAVVHFPRDMTASDVGVPFPRWRV